MTALASWAVNELAKMTYFVNVVINVSFISLDKLTSVEEGPPACYRLTSPDFGVRRVPPRLTLTYDASMRNKRGALLTRFSDNHTLFFQLC